MSKKNDGQQPSTSKPVEKPIEVVDLVKLADDIEAAWKNYSLDAPRMPNPIPTYTQGLRRMCMIVLFVLSLTKLIIGAHYVNECPTNPWLPTYMLVGGTLQLCFLLVLVYRPLRKPLALGILGLAVLIWMMIASFNILVEWKPDFFLGGWRYCNRVFFYFCFFVSLAEYIIFAVLLLYICTNFAYSRKDDSEKPQTLVA